MRSQTPEYGFVCRLRWLHHHGRASQAVPHAFADLAQVNEKGKESLRELPHEIIDFDTGQYEAERLSARL